MPDLWVIRLSMMENSASFSKLYDSVHCSFTPCLILKRLNAYYRTDFFLSCGVFAHKVDFHFMTLHTNLLGRYIFLTLLSVLGMKLACSCEDGKKKIWAMSVCTWMAKDLICSSCHGALFIAYERWIQTSNIRIALRAHWRLPTINRQKRPFIGDTHAHAFLTLPWLPRELCERLSRMAQNSEDALVKSFYPAELESRSIRTWNFEDLNSSHCTLNLKKNKCYS